MATNSPTFQDAVAKLKIPDIGENRNAFDANDITAASLNKHLVAASYTILGITPEEANKQYGATTVAYNDIKADFKKICFDFLDDIQKDKAYKAIDFCVKMIYIVGPEARQIRKRDGDRTWRFNFLYNINGKLVKKVAFVSTYKTEQTNYEYAFDTDKIVLSVKTATLLAIEELELINKYNSTLTTPVMLLTPLAGAVFSREDIPKIAQSLGVKDHFVILNVINASCQSGGQYLANSMMHCAAVAAIVATRNVKDEKMRHGIIGKTLKQYVTMKKEWNLVRFQIYSRFGHGGVPENISPEKLISFFDDIQRISPNMAVKAAKESATETQTHAVASGSQSPTI